CLYSQEYIIEIWSNSLATAKKKEKVSLFMTICTMELSRSIYIRTLGTGEKYQLDQASSDC
ncbi:hypothetical protein IFM89_020540, partial [Coptis chinensis]